jgi:hypothetical protein
MAIESGHSWLAADELMMTIHRWIALFSCTVR